MGFYLLWTAETLLGLALLWGGVRLLQRPAAGKRTVFALYDQVAAMIVPAVTLNYCILRYSLPFSRWGCCHVPAPKYDVYTFVPVCSFMLNRYHWVHLPMDSTFGYGLMRHN